MHRNEPHLEDRECDIIIKHLRPIHTKNNNYNDNNIIKKKSIWGIGESKSQLTTMTPLMNNKNIDSQS